MDYLPLAPSKFIEQYRQVESRKENKEFMLKFGKLLWTLFYCFCIYFTLLVGASCFNHGISII